jgi:dUTP pyrophosphatase
MNEVVKIFKQFDEAHLPVYGTDWAACFDLKASFKNGDVVNYFDQNNKQCTEVVQGGNLTLRPSCRMLVPTGLIFDLNEDQSLRIHPRSGLALKNGVTLINCEGVVDSDYINPTYITLCNFSDEPFIITDGMRLAQGEIVSNRPVSFSLIDSAPVAKTNRQGGFGSTGVK